MALATTVAFLATLAATAGAQSDSATGTVQGRVFEAMSKRTKAGTPATYVNVVVLNTQRGATTDEAGRFFITRVPTGTHTLRVQAPGYDILDTTVTVQGSRTVDVGSLTVSGFFLDHLDDGPVVEYFRPDLVPRLRRARLGRVSMAGAWLANPIPPTLAGAAGDAWERRFLDLLADSTAYGTYPGFTKKVCIFHEDVRVQLEDASGILDLKFCFGCSDLHVFGGERPNFREFKPVYLPFLDLMLEAFPGESRLLDYRKKAIDAAARAAGRAGLKP